LIILGRFWGFVIIALVMFCFLKIITHMFYHKFIRGLSKRRNRKLIDISTKILKSLDRNHTLCGIGALTALIIHGIIMSINVGFSFSGFLAGVSILFVIVIGLMNKLMYRDKRKELIKFHVIGSLVVVLMILLHISLN
jgi:hypothetical protein